MHYEHFEFPCRDEILELLNTNRRASNDLVADVLDQSADNLIDGVTSGKLNSKTSVVKLILLKEQFDNKRQILLFLLRTRKSIHL